MYSKKLEIKIIFIIVALFFIVFLFAPLIVLLKSSLNSFNPLFHDKNILISVENSIQVSSVAAIITTILAFILSYAVNCTNIFKSVKEIISVGISIPMLLPTITYGFVIIYSFGKQGFLTKVFGRQLFQIYGFNGLLMGYVIYTIPFAFLLINNSFSYIDNKFTIVSKLMGDNFLKSFINTIIRPLIGTLGGAFVLTFILSFTDFGIPASVGGNFNVISTLLYQVMLGSIPNFNSGSAIAVIMLFPAVIGILFLNYLEKFNFHYDGITTTEIVKNKFRDVCFSLISILTIAAIISIFLIMFIAPFVANYPYDMRFTAQIFIKIFFSSETSQVYLNSIYVSILSSILGALTSYTAALINVRTGLSKKITKIIDIFSMVTNSVPGMVLGLAYLIFFNNSDIKGTFAIIIICNIIHLFTTPYLMAKNSFSKMNPAWETTGELMGDTWIKTIIRVIVPNSISTIIEMFSYYFINSMVTISAIIFLVGARTSVITSRIKELQHFEDYNEIFILSILIFLTNIIIKICCHMINKKRRDLIMKKILKLSSIFLIICFMLIGLSGCTSKGVQKVVIYTNADDEAVQAMEKSLKDAGYDGKYVLKTFGTSELGGKLMAEGDKIEANLITMSSYFIDSSQKKYNMYENLNFDTNSIEKYPSYYTPILANTGSIFVNTQVMKDKGLTMPTSIKDLGSAEYNGLVSIPNIMSSSTAWLLVQAIVSQYGETEGKDILHKIIQNCGPNLESSGSGPIKKVRVGEAAIGFGLRHQAVADKAAGKPIDYVDPIEGNYSLTESIAVVKKSDTATTELAQDMAKVIITKARAELIKSYPVALYKGESIDDLNKPSHPKKFSEPLTVDLLQKHEDFFNAAK